MMPPNHLNRHARLNDERRLTTARAVLTEAQGEAGWATLTDGAKVMYAVGLLICDDAGIIKKDALEVAMADPQIIATAMALLFETGAQ